MTNLFKRSLTSLALIFILYYAITNNFVLSVVLFFLVFIVFIEFNGIIKKIFDRDLLKFFSLIFILFYLLCFSLSIWLFLIDIDELNKQKLILILSICISTDIGGYIFGKIIKGKKLTSLSPNKTYAGMIGSFILSLVTVTVLFKNIDIEISLIPYTIIISTISQLGDLFISMLKRKAKIKDTGNFLPGHGGLLDRIDGILFAVPFGLVIISL